MKGIDPLGRRWLAVIALLVLASAIGLARTGASGDSVTVDEPSHLVAGYAALALGDYRLSPDHPPLARMILALPLLAQPVEWRARETDAWPRGDFLTVGRAFFEEWNNGQRMAQASRMVAIAGLVGCILTIGALGRTLFGPTGGVLAMSVAAFDPALLAHGHLATMDVPFSSLALLTLFTAHRWLAKPTKGRLAVLALTFTAATLVKFSWFALVPALLAMAFAGRSRGETHAPARSLMAAGATITVVAVIGIWMVYGFRFAAANGPDAPTATMHVLGDYGRTLPATRDAAWESVLHDPATGANRPGPVVPLLRAARSLRALPEAYLYGLAYVIKKGETRGAYLKGEYSMTGFRDYFVWAFILKTPLPTLLMVGASLPLVFFLCAFTPGDALSPLRIGLSTFALTYLAILATSSLNLGYRHLLPVTTILMVVTGGLVSAYLPVRVQTPARVSVAIAVVWLAVGTWRASPHLLGFFNEAAGGWSRGHLYLADSNLDWGQDLLRLEQRLRSAPPNAPIWLAQAGDPPLPQGLRVRWLLGEGSHAPAAEPVGAGLYAISASELLGVYRPLARVTSWRDTRLIERFEAMSAARGESGSDSAAPGGIEPYEALRRLRLLSRLSLRAPDERIGTSLFLFRLSKEDITAATEP